MFNKTISISCSAVIFSSCFPAYNKVNRFCMLTNPVRPSGPVHGGRADEPLLDRSDIRDMLDQAGWLTPELLPALG